MEHAKKLGDSADIPADKNKYFGHSGWYFGQPWRTGGAKTRKEQTKELSERSRFYRLVRDKAAQLVDAQGAEIDTAVDDCRARMGEHFVV